MLRLILIFSIFFITNCSFDNKTGIWKDASETIIEPNKDISDLNENKEYKKQKTISQKEYDDDCKWGIVNPPKCKYKIISTYEASTSRSELEDVFLTNKIFNEEIKVNNNVVLKIDTPLSIKSWSQEFLLPNNNIPNLKLNGKTITKKYKLKDIQSKLYSNSANFLINEDNLVFQDKKGQIVVFSLKNNKKVWTYNFYKKEYKKYKKKISFIINKNVIFAADNLGYVYALDIKSQSILWSKFYGIPFRSNLKIIDNQLFLANQDNILYSINKQNGLTNWTFATSLTFLKNKFQNNLAIDLNNNNINFLNTSGELYSINYLNKKINWVLNFKYISKSDDLKQFLGKPIILSNDNILISTENSFLNYNSFSGAKNWSKPIHLALKPIISKNFIYLFTANNLLICLDLTNGNVIWSQNIFNDIKSKKQNKIGTIQDLKIINNNISLFSNNGYMLSFNYKDGLLIDSNKISRAGLLSKPIFTDGAMYLIDKKKKLLTFR